jgi:hypothetical protein
MAKFEITHGKAVKEVKDGKAVCFEVGDTVEFDKLPASLVGKARELAQTPKAVKTEAKK